MNERALSEQLVQRRMHSLFLSRKCDDIETLARHLMGLHCWFFRNVPFSALIRGADITGIKSILTKTWLYRGTLHGALLDDLPELLALSQHMGYLSGHLGREVVDDFAAQVLRYMEDGVFSRAEFRKIFADHHDPKLIEHMFSQIGRAHV